MILILKIAYNGTNYHGLSYQPKIPTIIGEFIKINEKLNLNLQNFQVAGRTDAGVHASNMIISANCSIKRNYFFLNHHLPSNIIVKAFAYKNSFSARFCCSFRILKYFFICDDFEFQKFKNFGELMKNKFETKSWNIEMFCTKSAERKFNKKNRFILKNFNSLEKEDNSNLLEKEDDLLEDVEDSLNISNKNKNSNFLEKKDNLLENNTFLEKNNNSFKNEDNLLEDSLNSNNFLNNSSKSNKLFNHSTFFDKNYYNRPIFSLNFHHHKKNIYFMRIKSKSFLHNQIRRIFYCLKMNVKNNNKKDEIIFFDGVAEPNFLIFENAEYPFEIEWIENDDYGSKEIEIEINKEIFLEPKK